MIQVGTKLQIIDNSGGQVAQCIRIKRKDRAKVGDTIVVAVQSALPQGITSNAKHRVKKGDLYPALVIQTKKSINRPDGSSIKNTQNSVILLTEKGTPLGTRVTSAFNFEIRKVSLRAWALTQHAH